jgi:hypothetical protein
MLNGERAHFGPSRLRAVLGGAALLAAASLSAPARAQDPFGGPGMFPGGGPSGGPSGGGGKKPKGQSKAAPPPGTPELHAASGAGDSLVPPGSEPTLPEHPLKLSPSVRDSIGSDLDPDLLERGRGSSTVHRFYGPYYEERSDKYRLRLAFPVWLERRQPSRLDPNVTDRASLFAFYYNRRSNERADDVLFPLFWDLKNRVSGDHTTIVGPLVHREAPGEHDNWLFPLYFTGKRKDGGYTLIPPLITYSHTNKEGGFRLVGPLFCSWKGGSECDARTAQDIDFGIAPLYFYGQNAESKYEVIPPLFHYYGYDDRTLSWTNIWGPYYRHHSQTRDALHLFPFYYSLWGKNERHTTVFPFFHYGHDEKSWLFANPLFLMAKGSEGQRTFVTWLYARHRGRTELDMITPFYWHYRDPDVGLDEQILFPFLYSRTSPRESSQAFFPFWGHFERFGISKSTWVTPFFNHSSDLRGWSTNIYPFVYLGRDATSTHTVVAPFFWDFANPTSRATVAFPFYFRFSDDHEVSQLVGNVYYHEAKVAGGLDWQIHIFPAFSYGETPDGHWWNVLYGLAGYTRRGSMTQVRTLWIPITLSNGRE